MLQQLFDEYQESLDFFFDQIDLSEVEAVISSLLTCRGTLIFTGVGKSGIIAEKLALTMISTGTKALFLPPLNALHGDIGIVSSQDSVILLSKSGESEELLQLIPHLQRRKAKTIAWVLTAPSKLAQASDLSITLPFKKELCPFDLAPTTSTTIELIFGDIVSIALMKGKSFDLDDYALNHPAGSLGKNINLKVKDLMLTGDILPLCEPQDRLNQVLVKLTSKQCGCLIVVDKKRHLQGIFTDGDLRRALQHHSNTLLEKKIKDLMTPHCIFTTGEERARDVLRLMQKDQKRWISVIPVIKDQHVIGLIRMHDIIKAGVR